MDYTGFVKSLDIPAGFVPPRHLVHEDLQAKAISRADLDDDVRGINSSLELIRRTRGGEWPAEAVSAELNYADLVWHELEFREGYSFAYVVRDADDRYLGCCYLYPIGRRVALTEELLPYDVDVSWWVTTDAYERGYYTRLYDALGQWIEVSFPFRKPYFSNRQIPDPESPS